MDRLAALEAFARVAETGSFSAAARALNLSKSLISRQISALEAELGARLIARTTRSLSLTEAGRGYYDQVARILAQMEEADLSVSQLQATPRGKLRVNAPMSFSLLRLAPVLPDFLALYPEIDVDIVMNDRRVDLMDEGFDLAIRLGRLADSSLVARKLGVMQRFIVGSPAYFARHKAPRTPADLHAHSCIRSRMPSGGIYQWEFERRGETVRVDGKGVLTLDEPNLMLEAARAGLGLAYLTEWNVAADLQAGTLVRVLADWTQPMDGLCLYYPGRRHVPAVLRALIGVMRENAEGNRMRGKKVAKRAGAKRAGAKR